MRPERDLGEQLAQLGFTLEAQGKHLKWRHANGRLLVTSVSPSDHRAFDNILRDARRVARKV